MKMRTLVCLFFVLALSAMAGTGCGPTTPTPVGGSGTSSGGSGTPGGEPGTGFGNPPDLYVLAYKPESGTSPIIRYSEDAGSTWEGGVSPEDITLLHGVGLMADRNGLFHIMLSAESNAIDMRWGLGLGVWDTTANLQRSHPVDSAPTGAPVGDGVDRWLVAYRSADRVVVCMYDNSSRHCAISDASPAGSANTQVSGRPVIIDRGDEFLLVWLTASDPNGAIATSIGRIDEGLPDFRTPSLISGQSSTYIPGFYTLAVANTPDHYYIAALRKTSGQGQEDALLRYDIVVYQSADGLSWNELGTVAGVTRGPQTTLGLAGQPDGSLLLFWMDSHSNGTEIGARTYDGQAWTSVSGNTLKQMVGCSNCTVGSSDVVVPNLPILDFALIYSGPNN